MKTLDELRKIREQKQSELVNRDMIDGDTVRVVVGMATCGIAAGARPVLTAFNEEINKRGLKNVKVTQTGCIGMCKNEPIVEIIAPNKEKVTYILLTPEKAARIVSEHLVNGHIVTDFLMKS